MYKGGWAEERMTCLFIQWFSIYSVPNTVPDSIHTPDRLEGAYEFPLLLKPMCKLECTSESPGSLDRLSGLSQTLWFGARLSIFNQFPGAAAAVVQGPCFKNNCSNKCADHLGTVQRQSAHWLSTCRVPRGSGISGRRGPELGNDIPAALPGSCSPLTAWRSVQFSFLWAMCGWEWSLRG